MNIVVELSNDGNVNRSCLDLQRRYLGAKVLIHRLKGVNANVVETFSHTHSP